MISNILWLLIIIIYLFCLFYNPEIKKKFNDNHEIKKKIIYGLEVIDKLFNKHNIYYTAAFGTLLGAVRHWDMIPWDDDGDLNIWRKDFAKIMSLENEFKEYGLILESNWKLIRVYFKNTNDNKNYPFIDLFINDIEDGKIIRCHEPFDKSCNYLDNNNNNNWWWDLINYPSSWIEQRKRLKFGPIEIWAPIESDKLLKYWYGDKYLSECKSHDYDHITNNYITPKNLNCGILPKPQF
jgi:phosphorylcholine metabolism protein LicD